MVIMKLNLVNILGFNNIAFDFSYPKKLAKNSIGNEFLEGIPSFRYKRVNVIVGSNSYGKSILGKAVWHICMFLKNKESKNIIDILAEGDDDSGILMDYITKRNKNKYIMNRVQIYIMKNIKNNDNPFDIRMSYSHVTLRKGDTYESACSDLVETAHQIPYLECLNLIGHNDGWLISAPMTESNFNTFELELPKKDRVEFNEVLSRVLKTLDPNITSVYPSEEVDNAYIVKYDDEKMTIVKNKDKILDIPYLSTGTKYGFTIAIALYSIGKHRNGLYYIDELFSYINSEIEVACLNMMISLLGDCEQLFFTTHNLDVLENPYPLHTFLFLGKDNNEGKIHIKAVCASDVEKRNNVVVKNLYENDYFNTTPKITTIFQIEELFKNEQ